MTLIPFATLLVFYWGFAAAILVYRKWLEGTLNTWNKVLFSPLLAAFWLTDSTLNYTVAVVMFGFPDKHDYTLSARFGTYRLCETGYKRICADFVCDKLLNNIDPTGNHC